MKKTLLSVSVALGLTLGASAQAFFEAVTFTGAFAPTGTSYTAKIEGGFSETFSTGDWTTGWANWFPNFVAYAAPDANNIVSGDIISDRSISGNVKLQGTVHVTNGATLTIAAGTVIRAGLGATLIIAKGSKISAVGTSSNPIVFTSEKPVGQRQPGDWAGILLIGNSQVNTANGTRQYEALPSDPLALYGGGRGGSLNTADNSGEMRFVRIEFAGYNYLPDQELNGLTLGAVGSGTKVNFIQVSYARDDSFEWFGGTSSHKYLVAYAGVDDDFDMDEGYAGNTQFILGVRNPFVYETAAGGTSNGFEHDNNTGVGTAGAVVPGNNDPSPNTTPFISNATLIGPWANRAVITGNKFGRGMEMRSAVATSVYNSVVIGYNSLAQLVHATPSIVPSVGMRLLKEAGITPAEYVNTHLIAVNTASGFAFTSASNQPASPVFNFATYMTSNLNSFKSGTPTSDIFENTVSDFNTSVTGISYAPKTSSFLAGVVATFPGLIASKTAAPEVFISLPSASVSKSSLAFGTKQVGETFTTLTFGLTFANLTGAGVTLTPSNSNFTATLSNVTSIGGTATVAYTKTTAGAESSSITVNFGDSRISNVVVPVTASLVNPAAPILVTDAASLSFVASELTTSATYTSNNQIIAISGRNLATDVTVTPPAGYEISLTPASGYVTTPLVLPIAANKSIATNIYVQLKSTTQSSSNAGSLTFASGSASTAVALSANTAAVFVTGTSITLDVFTNQVVSTVGTGVVNVRGDRLPASILLTPNTADVELSLVGANGPWASTVTLTTTGRITSTSANIWARYLGAIAPTTNGVQIGTVSVTGVGQVIPVSIRLNAPSAVIQSNYILTDAASREITAVGFTFTSKLRSTPFLYKANGNALIGQVSVLGSNVATLRANALVATNTFNTAITFAGTIMSDAASVEITGTGTAFDDMKLPAGLPLHYSDGSLIGYVSTVTAVDKLTLQANALVTSMTGSSFGTSAIFYKRSQATVSNSAGSPIAFTPSSFTAGVPTPVTIVTTLTGDNHDFPVNVGINPILSASGYMFEVYLGAPTTFSGNSFSVVAPVNANGQLNQVVTIRYVPSNITSLGLPGLNINAAHSTELLVLGNNRALASGRSSSDPRATIAINLRGNSQSSLTVIKTTLAKFVTYRGLSSGIQKFNLSGSRILKDIMLSAPANFLLSTSADFTGASNTLTIPATVAGLTPSLDINVKYMRADVGSDNGSISIVTEGIAALSVGVSGESIGFATLVDFVSASGASTVSFTGITMATVSGSYLTAALTVTASTDFEVSETIDGTYTSSLSFSPDPSDFGDVAPKAIFAKYKGTARGFAGTITAASGATSSVINLVYASGTDAVTDALAISKVVVYPNPTEGAATLAVEFAGTETITVNVYDMAGTEVSSFFATVSGVATYPIAGLSKGVYVIKVATTSSVKTLKLVVN